jgi:hypothetical protein
MGGWKTSIRVSDLDESQKLEITCLRCGRLRYLTKAELPDPQLFLDEVEHRLSCSKRGCKGRARLSIVRLDKLSGFVGGLA